jgi:hypothetical protein
MSRSELSQVEGTRSEPVQSSSVQFDAEASVTGNSKPTVTAQQVSAVGNLTDAEGKQVIEHNLGRWQSCYSAVARNDPALCGWMRVEVDYHRHGGFGHSFAGSSITNAELLSCLSFDLGAPSPALAAPGTTFEFTLVFSPAERNESECEPPKALIPIDRGCTTDADCTGTYSMYVTGPRCCRSCNTEPVAKTWADPAGQACTTLGSEGCPMKKCAALQQTLCKRGSCVLRR